MPVSCCGANNRLNTACCQTPPEDTTAASIAKVKKVYLNMAEKDVEGWDTRISPVKFSGNPVRFLGALSF